MVKELEHYGLGTNDNLKCLAYSNEDDWLELRTKGIGGSDIGAVMGLNKYTSALQIYKAKVLGEAKDVSGKSAVKKGKDLEPLIRSKYFDELLKGIGYTIKEVPYMLINNKYPWLRANLDGIGIPLDESKQVHSKCIVCEIKVVTEYAEDNWYKDEYCGVPASYYAQVQEYMLVTETKMAILGALFEKDWEMHYFKIPADRAFQEELLRTSKEFYDYNMGLKIPPKFDAELDKEDIIKELEKPVIETIETQEITDLGIQYKDLNKILKDIETKKKSVATEITNRYLKGERSNSPLVKIKIGTTTRSSIDIAKLKEDHPEIAKQYENTVETTNTYIR